MFLSITQAAKMAGISRATIYKLHKDGKLSFVTSPSGKQGVDASEFSRLYKLTTYQDTKGNYQSTGISQPSFVEKENEVLKYKVTFLEEHIKTLQTNLEREQERMTSLLKMSEKLMMTHERKSGGLLEKLSSFVSTKRS